jgi:hypothetical protein
MTPKYTHDCTSCEYKGTHFGYDVYHCSVSGIGLSPYTPRSRPRSSTLS